MFALEKYRKANCSGFTSYFCEKTSFLYEKFMRNAMFLDGPPAPPLLPLCWDLWQIKHARPHLFAGEAGMQDVKQVKDETGRDTRYHQVFPTLHIFPEFSSNLSSN